MDPLLNKRSLLPLLLVTGLWLVAGSAGAFVPSAKPLAACKTLQSTRAVASVLPHTPSSPRPISRLRLADSAIAEKWSPPDFGEIAKYGLATGVQFALIAGAFRLIDGAALRVAPSGKLPLPAVGLLFVFLSLRSRVASVLDNSRPNRDAQDGGATPPDVRRPSWTPPGIAFPFIWLTITALRGASSAIVYGSVGALATGPLLAMVLHLCIGDTWNTVTNVEKRLGVSAMGCLLVWASVINAIVRYYRVSPLAGKILAPSGAWISIATVLTMTIWRINTPIQPPWPVKGDGKSAAFKWSNLGQLQATTIGGSTPTVKKRKINNLIDLESKKVATMEMVEPPAKKVYCRCWQSGTFPLCDGSHMKHNEATGDNVGPLIVTVKEQ